MLRRQPSVVGDEFSARWASLVQRSRQGRLFGRRGATDELVREFEALAAERRAADDLPYAALVTLSLARCLEGAWEKAACYLEASDAFWEAAHQDHERGCTEPPELLRLHARDAQAKSVFWFEKAGNAWLHGDTLLHGAIHLKRLGEYEEAAFYATQAATLEAKREQGSAFDAYDAFSLAAECFARNHSFTELDGSLESMRSTAQGALKADSTWAGFHVSEGTPGWHSTWTEAALLMVAVARLLLNAVWNRHGQMQSALQGDLRRLLTARDGHLQCPLWNACVTLVDMRNGLLPCLDARLAEAVDAVQDECGEEPVVLVLVEELSAALRHHMVLE